LAGVSGVRSMVESELEMKKSPTTALSSDYDCFSIEFSERMKCYTDEVDS